MATPIVSAYIDMLAVWYPPEQVIASITKYIGKVNHLILAFWENTGPVDVALAWSNGTFPSDAIDEFHSLGVKVMVSAGGGTASTVITENPTGGRSYGEALGTWARDQKLDGVDFDIEDNYMFQNKPQTAIQWMVDATQGVKSAFPDAIISHAPQAPYFSPVYGNGPYLSINQQAGNDIDFYNIQFYNQGSSSYDTYTSLFVTSNGWATGTAVGQLVQAGVPLDKIVVGKPVTPADAANTGYVPASEFAAMIEQAGQNNLLPAGAMGWQFRSDAGMVNWSTELYDALSGVSSTNAVPQALRMAKKD